MTTHTISWNGRVSEEDEQNHVCSRPGCGAKSFDDGAPLTYITVVTNNGEEGYGEVTQALCIAHLQAIASALIMLGFVSHNHHGTQMFGDEYICGRDCPTPTEYGPELVQPTEHTCPVDEVMEPVGRVSAVGTHNLVNVDKNDNRLALGDILYRARKGDA